MSPAYNFEHPFVQGGIHTGVSHPYEKGHFVSRCFQSNKRSDAANLFRRYYLILVNNLNSNLEDFHESWSYDNQITPERKVFY